MIAAERATAWAQDLAAREALGAFARRHAVTLLLCAILVVGGALRLNGRNWDQDHYLHPDERFMVMVEDRIQWPGGVGAYFDSEHSTLNPYNNDFGSYVYGTFPLFLGKFVADLSGQNVYRNFHIPARTLSTLFDLSTISAPSSRSARRLFGDRTGLFAALLQSLTVLHIQASHFFTTDNFLATLCVAIFLFRAASERPRQMVGIRVGRADDGSRPRHETQRLAGDRDAVASPGRNRCAPRVGKRFGTDPGPARCPPGWAPLSRSSLASGRFGVAQPYAFAGPSPFSFKFDSRWTHDISYWKLVQAGTIDMPPSVQWAARTPFLFLWKNVILWGLGLPLGIAAFVALGLAIFRIATSRRWPATWQVILVGWPLFHLVYYGGAFIKTMRYALPALPFLTILAAAMLVGFWERGIAANPARFTWRALPALLVVGLTAAYAIAFSGIYSRHRPGSPLRTGLRQRARRFECAQRGVGRPDSAPLSR